MYPTITAASVGSVTEGGSEPWSEPVVGNIGTAQIALVTSAEMG